MGMEAENADKRPRIYAACQPICCKGLEAISPLTVKAHHVGINRTLGVSSKAAAVAQAFRRGILS